MKYLKKDMTAGKEWKQILLFTLPIMAGTLLQQLYNAVDGVVVGQFASEDAFAGVATCQPLTMLFLSLAMGLSIGVGIVVAQYFGAKKHDSLPVCIETALVMLGVCGLFLTVTGVLITPILLKNVLSVPTDIMKYAAPYFRIYSCGLFFQFVYNSIAAVLRGLGESKATLFFLLIATVLNMLLDLLFVAVFRWNVTGAAFATVIAQFVCVTVSYIYLRRQFPFSRTASHWNRGISVTMVKLGLPIAIQQSLVSVGQGSMQRLVNSFSASVPGLMAAYGAGLRLNSFVHIPIMGFQSGLANFTGQNIGANNYRRVYRGFRVSLLMSLSITVVVCILLYIFAAPVLSVFGLSDEGMTVGVTQVRFLALFFWMFSCYITLGGLLQGAGDTVLQSITTLSAFGMNVVSAYSLVHLGILGYNAAWTMMPVGWGLAIIISYTRFFTGGWKKKAVAGKNARGLKGAAPSAAAKEQINITAAAVDAAGDTSDTHETTADDGDTIQ